MNRQTVGIIGLTTTILFISGFASLFVYHPPIFEEVDSTSIAFFNVREMNGRWLVAYVNYLTIGLLNLAFVLGLKISKNDLPMFIGKVLLLIAGAIWASFGLISWDPSSETDIHTVLTRVIILLLAAPLGLIFLGTEFQKIVKGRFAKYFTLATGLAILLLAMMSVFVPHEQTWIRTNFALTLYFLWFGVIGVRLVQKPAPNEVHTPLPGES